MKYTEEQIDAYLREGMSAREKAEFEAEMKRDPDMAREVSMMRLLIGGLKDRQDKLDAMATWQKEAEQKSASRAKSTGQHHTWGHWIAVLSAAAAVVVGVFFYRSPPTSLPQPTEPPVMRSAGFSSLDSLLEQGAYQKAIEVIEAELAETDSLLQESIRIREEAEYDIEKYEWVIRSLNQKLDQIRNMQKNR